MLILVRGYQTIKISVPIKQRNLPGAANSHSSPEAVVCRTDGSLPIGTDPGTESPGLLIEARRQARSVVDRVRHKYETFDFIKQHVLMEASDRVRDS